MIKMKKMTSLGLSAVMLLSLTSCGSKSVSYDPLPEDDDTVYNLTICQSVDSDYYNTITAGFTDALTDTFGENHVTVDTQISSAENTSDTICQNAVANESNLIFANGAAALSSATSATESTPVVGAGIVDFQSALHIVVDGDSNWDKKSATNVTGIAAIPPIDDQLSLLIEATPNLETIGILYSSDDTDAIYQNEIFEKYLDQAGIPWKEYVVPTTDTADTSNVDTASAITPSKVVASSAKEGSNMNVESFGENSLLSGINSPASNRTAKTSAFWYGPKGSIKPAVTEDTTDTTTDTVDGTVTDTTEEDTTEDTENTLAEDATAEEVVSFASSECSALYIPSESFLSDQIEMIGSVTTAAGVTTLGGDTALGNNTLVTLFVDPYNMGYAAGKLAYRILVNGENPGDIKITANAGSSVKLYNQDIANAFGMTFPKSFSEYHDYLANYTTGDLTTRVANDSE